MNRHDDYLRCEVPGLALDKLALARFTIADAPVADPDGILKQEAFPATAGYVATFLKQPPKAMTLTLVATATQTGNVIIEGLDIGGNEISETVKMTSATPVATTKAFSKVVRIKLPQKVGTEKIDVGWGSSFGLPYRLNFTAQVISHLFNGAADAGAAAVDKENLAGNTYTPAGTLDGEKPLDFYIMI